MAGSYGPGETLNSLLKQKRRYAKFLCCPQSVGKSDGDAPLFAFLLSCSHFEVHLIVDNYATHKHAKVRTWLARRPRFHIHYTPTYSSWLNQVERWFGMITQRAIRRGSFRSVKELTEKIDAFVNHYNRSSRPFAWTATADSILQKIARLCSRISGTAH